MKTYYNPEGDPCWIDTLVEILAWDGDKWITFKNSIGEVSADKLWKFSIKRSNKLYKLPRGYMEDTHYVSNKDVTKELKTLRKRRVLYTAYTSNLNHHTGQDKKTFKRLKKALNFCRSNPTCTFLHQAVYKKYSSHFHPVLERDGDWWYYYPNKTNTSSKTLNNWVMSN